MPSKDLRRKISAGAEIIREGEQGDYAYIIESGLVEISTVVDGARVTLAQRGAGDIFGEMAIVDSKPRSATVTAIEDCEVLLLSEEALQHRLRTMDPVLRMVFGVILDRFRQSIRQVSAESCANGGAPEGEPVESDAHRAAIARIELEQSLRRALADGEMVLHHQPLIACADMSVAGFEALARWQHPERGLLGPYFFIEAAEESGFITEISRWAVGQACLAARRFEASALFGDDLFVNVNVTAADVCDVDFLNVISQALEDSDVAPERLGVEITESNLMDNPEFAVDMLNKIRALGATISIDDFGTGYSSLNYLTRYPAQKLKIDKCFVDDLATDAKAADVMKTMISLGKGLGMEIVAEGVETAEQARILCDLGCNYLQGYLFSKPLPFGEALAFAERCRAEPMKLDDKAAAAS